MRITKELNLTDFNFWGGAKNHDFTYNELKEIEYILEDLYFDNLPTETDINDLFWFEEETICEWLNLDYDKYLKR